MTHLRPMAIVLCVGTALVVAGCATGTQVSESAAKRSSDASLRAYLESNASSLATNYGILDPPEIEMIRLIELDEWADTQRECLREAGFDVELTADGEGLAYPPAADAAVTKNLNLAIYTCEMKYPVDPKYMAPLTPVQLEKLYQYRAGELVSCLEGHGYTVPTQPPSQEVFVEDGGQWSPYEGVAIDDGDLRRVAEACPQVPATLYEQ